MPPLLFDLTDAILPPIAIAVNSNIAILRIISIYGKIGNMKTRIRELAEKAGITTAYQLQKATGLSSSMAARLYRDDVEMISLTTMAVLCAVLNCEPNDLFVYQPSAPATKPAETRPTKKAKKK